MTSPTDATIAKLSPRQMEIAALLVQGKSYEQVATILSISQETVKWHVQRACQKMDLENRIQLIVMFARWQMRQEIKE
jgi:DNA-binding CsgD family transcriptional regulator